MPLIKLYKSKKTKPKTKIVYIYNNNMSNSLSLGATGLSMNEGQSAYGQFWNGNVYYISSGKGLTLRANGGSASTSNPLALEGLVQMPFGMGAVQVVTVTGTDQFTKAVRNITVATVAPSGGIQGDIWIQI